MPTIDRHAPAVERDAVAAGRLPARYGLPMQAAMVAALDRELRDGVRILDVGAGRSPTLAPTDRPAGTRYVGLDLAAAELEAAGEGAYDRTIVHDVCRPLALDESFDVVVSWQVLEHVSSVSAALDTLGSLLRPGGVLLAQLSGARAVFAVAARVTPHPLRVLAMTRLLGHAAEEKFPTAYDRCTASALRGMLRGWQDVDVLCHYRGATYFDFNRLLQRAYLAYEDRIAAQRREDLATHYLVAARR